MLKKLLKYDIRAVAGLWWIGAAVSVGASILGAILMRFSIAVSDSNTPSVILKMFATLALIVGIFCVIAVAVSYVFTMILVFVRFYRHFFTDEGYLTFTLPVKRSTLLLSKSINAVIWFAAHSLVVGISMLIFAVLVTPPKYGGFFINFALLDRLWEFISLLWQYIGAWLIVYILEGLLALLVSLMFSVFLIQFCITVGSVLVKKAKLIVSVAIYYAVTSALTTSVQIGAFVFTNFMARGFSILVSDITVDNQGYAMIALALLGLIAVFSAVSTAIYSVTQYMLDRKLNLA